MSETAVRLIFAAETRTNALVLRNKTPAPAATTSRSLAAFQATSIFIRAKLEAFYDDQTLALQWKRYTNPVDAFNHGAP